MSHSVSNLVPVAVCVLLVATACGESGTAAPAPPDAEGLITG
jgi:hypothetical protein